MSGNKMQWFKCKPDPFLSALAEMDADCQHLYAVVILKIYARGGPIRHDVKALATFCRRSVKATQVALDRLMEMGRITLADGHLSNPVAEEELASREAISNSRSINGKEGGLASGSSRREKGQGYQRPGEPIASDYGSKTKQERSDKDKDKESTAREGRRDDAAVEAALRCASGLENDPSPGLMVLGPIHALIAEGYDLDRHILPVLRSLKAKGKRWRTWGYVVDAVREQNTLKPMTAQATPPKAPTPISDEIWDKAVAQYKRTRHWLFGRDSLPPDDPLTKVPAHILAAHGYGRAAA